MINMNKTGLSTGMTSPRRKRSGSIRKATDSPWFWENANPGLPSSKGRVKQLPVKIVTALLILCLFVGGVTVYHLSSNAIESNSSSDNIRSLPRPSSCHGTEDRDFLVLQRYLQKRGADVENVRIGSFVGGLRGLKVSTCCGCSLQNLILSLPTPSLTATFGGLALPYNRGGIFDPESNSRRFRVINLLLFDSLYGSDLIMLGDTDTLTANHQV